MTHARIQMFLQERDRARLRNDGGVDRSLTADLRRLGVPDNATLADPSGKHAAPAVATLKRGPGRPKLPRCEHGVVADRCPECTGGFDIAGFRVPFNSRLLAEALDDVA